MYIIKLNAIDSTSNYLKLLCAKTNPRDFTVVTADMQTNGRGQMGYVWSTEGSKNLTFSVYKDVSFLNIESQFYISIAVALGVFYALQHLEIPKLKIKWPNDILADSKKVAGILIENTIKQTNLSGSIIGVGLNVNQTQFIDLPKASSLKKITGNTFNRETVLSVVLKHIKAQLLRLENESKHNLKAEYQNHLFRVQKPSTFKTPSGQLFSGIIEGITEAGKLNLQLEDKIYKTYNLKEIELLY